MLFELRRVPLADLDALYQDPSDIFFYLSGEEPYQPPKSFFKRVFGPKTPPKPKREWTPPSDDMLLDLETNWHVLHYVLCRNAWEGPLPQATLLSGGTELGKVDVGYGPARGLNPMEADDFLTYLSSLNKEQYALGIEGKDFVENDIYGGYTGWNSDDAANLWDYIEALKAFLTKAKQENHGIILHLY
ncbi:DUF1877 family protein [Methylomonas rosea]|uniref:YfbM family protein n=1 Tax=Methylomonas rosea TaxID=2952227 RepID=A0ABT1TR79_9GAMM|nr:DUF1877 family protein [Methylomonas sp. WSC-7]MCQ8117002.1 YfbM family protein [Methylomonas sp. WSC-7]